MLQFSRRYNMLDNSLPANIEYENMKKHCNRSSLFYVYLFFQNHIKIEIFSFTQEENICTTI